MKAGYRIYHGIVGIAVRCLKFPKQEMISGRNCLVKAAELVEKHSVKSVFITCSRSVHRNGLMDEMLALLEKKGIKYVIYEDINANPTVGDVDRGYEIYIENNCEAIITIGGGSPMDCAKGIGLRVTNPKLSYEDMRSMLKIRHRPPYTVAVPTTAGTGSESTAAAVISNPEKHDKYAIISPKLMPHAVILDAGLTAGLPKNMTAYTGMDALTHAIEAYIGVIDTKYTDKMALEAIRMIFEWLERACDEPQNLEARDKMLLASNKAGAAFTRVYVGYVHAVSHALSALYNVGHGKTNAIILPLMLEYYGEAVYSKLAQIARYCKIEGTGDKELALTLISEIRDLNETLGIPSYVEELKEEDIPVIVRKVMHEANPGYPVPRILTYEEIAAFVRGLLKKQ